MNMSKCMDTTKLCITYLVEHHMASKAFMVFSSMLISVTAMLARQRHLALRLCCCPKTLRGLVLISD